MDALLTTRINELCAKYIGRKPNLHDPSGYNDLMQWLKLYDQRIEQIAASDKISARDIVRNIAGDFAIVPALYVSDRFNPNEKRYPYIAKASHNSGTCYVVKSDFDLKNAARHVNSSLNKKYGLKTGEWYYSHIKPGVIAEKVLLDNTDYKFHVSHGSIKWVQVIWDRGANVKEAIFTPEGSVTDLHMDEKMRHTPDKSKFPGAEAWGKLSELALRIAEGWRYIRVDLYWSEGKPYFGEMTFHPRAGCYKNKSEQTFGEMLDLDLSYKLELDL